MNELVIMIMVAFGTVSFLGILFYKVAKSFDYVTILRKLENENASLERNRYIVYTDSGDYVLTNDAWNKVKKKEKIHKDTFKKYIVNS